MADKKGAGRNDLFKRLTQLFRGGPTVRKKVRAFRTPTASTAAEVFKKSYSQVYSNALNSYGQYDRMSRYADFSECEYTPEIASALDIYAAESSSADDKGNVLHIYSNNPKIHQILTELFNDTLNVEFNLGPWTRNLPIRQNTLIPLLDGRNITIKQLADEFASGKKNYVYSVKKDSLEFVPGFVTWCGLTRVNSELVRVWLDDGSYVDTSPDHEFLLRSGEQRRADQLATNDSLMPFYRDVSSVKKGHKIDHRVARIERLIEHDDVYCMEVLGPNGEHDRHNFMVLGAGKDDLNSGVCLANCKFGDAFLFLDIHPEQGVINAFPMPVNEVERDEGWDPKDPLAVRFRWVTQGNQILESWQVAHFRLLGNDAFLPYGSSVLESARRIWRQLILIEDAMLVYRVVRSPERRVFYIDVGTVSTEEIPNYMEAAQSKLKRSQVIDKSTGRIDLRYNPLPVWSKSRIPLLDGRCITIEELAREYEQGKQNWVYSVQDGTHRAVPGKVAWCGKNYTADRLVKVHLDDDTWVMTAPEHPFLLRDGMKRRADELKPGDSLMPLYRKLSNLGYEQWFNPESDKYEMTHKLVALDVYKDKWDQEFPVVHHKHPENGSSNKRNNIPDNLEVMDFWEHRKWHQDRAQVTINRPEFLAERSEKWKIMNSTDDHKEVVRATNIKYKKAQRMGAAYNGSSLHKEHNENRREGQLTSWKNDKEKRSKAMKWQINKDCVDIVAKMLQTSDLPRDSLFAALMSDSSFRAALQKTNEGFNRSLDKFNVRTFLRHLETYGYKNFDSLRTAVRKNEFKFGSVNHKVVAIEWVDGPEDVYCMTVVGPNGEEDRHNFSVCSLYKDDKQGYSYNGIVVSNSVDEDYFVPVRGGESGTKIDTLAGGQHVSDIADVEYIQKKLFSALKVPKAYLGYDDALCLGKDEQIQLLTGKSVRISDLASRPDADDLRDVWVWSMRSDGSPVPGRVKRAWKTKDVTELYAVRLDSGRIVRCTGNHPFMLRDGTYKRADALASGDSLMPVYRNLFDESGIKHWGEFEKKFLRKNHSVVSVEVVELSQPEPVFDIEVEGQHNFGIVADDGDVPSLIIVHNSSKATLSQEDIRFSRSINKIQQVIISELQKIAIIHLFAHGFEGDDLLDFNLQLSNPSTVAQQQKLELWRTKFEIAGTAPEGLVDRDFIRREIFQLTDEQIDAIRDGRRRDRMEDMELEASELEGNAPAGGGGAGGLGGLPGGGGGDDVGGPGDEAGGPGALGGDEGAVSGGDKPDEDLFAGDTPDGKELLTSNDDDADDEGSSPAPGVEADASTVGDVGTSLQRALVTIGKDAPAAKGPAKTTQLSKYLYDRGRRRTHGARKTHMPDFNGMVSYDADPDDRRHFNANPFAEGVLAGSIVEDDVGQSAPRVRLSAEMKSMLSSFARRLDSIRTPSNESTVLVEGITDEESES